METLQLLQKAITQFYYDDRTRPSITLSYLGEADTTPYYASIIRYQGSQRTVVCHVKTDSFDSSIMKLAETWRNIVSPRRDALSALQNHLDGK